MSANVLKTFAWLVAAVGMHAHAQIQLPKEPTQDEKPTPVVLAPTQVPSPVAQSVRIAEAKPTPATIGQITDLARDLRIEQLKAELRKAKEASAPAPVLAPLALPMPLVRDEPAPRVEGIYASNGQELRALVNGRELERGDVIGPWRVISMTTGGVLFERCKEVRKKLQCSTSFSSVN